MFNNILLAARKIHYLNISANISGITYNVKDQVLSQYGVDLVDGDTVVLDINPGLEIYGPGGGSTISFWPSTYPNSILYLDIGAGTTIAGGGGPGGDGGDWTSGNQSVAGNQGGLGGTALFMGCPTIITGSGTIMQGYGGGGGGSTDAGTNKGGGGGGGGAAYGIGGQGGTSSGPDSPDGTAATLTARGLGGSGSGVASGGNGGDSGNSPQAGSSVSAAGGAAGSNGNAINKAGFSLSYSGVTITGSIV